MSRTHYKDCWRWAGHHDCAVTEIERLYTELAQACAEPAAISELVAQAKQMRIHACAYCGYQYPLESTLTEHIKSCPEHPLAKVRAELARSHAELDAVDEALGEYHRSSCEDHGIYLLRQRLSRMSDQSALLLRCRLSVREERDLKCQLAKAEAELDRVRQNAQDWRDEVQAHWLSPRQKEGLESLVKALRRKLKHTEDRCDYWLKAHDEMEVEAEGLRRQLATAERRAENTEAKLSNGHKALTAAGAPRSDVSGKLSICGRVVRLRQRAERAEALAALVNEKTVDLLERLASHTAAHADSCAAPDSSWVLLRRAEIRAARALAAEIREALDGDKT